MRRSNRQRMAVAVAMTLAAGVAVAVPSVAHAAVTATIDGATTYQRIDGFGFSEHFGRANIMRGSQGLPEQKQREVLDLLLSRKVGAGLSILRLGISSGSNSIQPTDPGGPDAPPNYVWDGDDNGQVWLARQAKAYGVTRFYADAWSAPGYMKTNGTEDNGGTLCGLSGAWCPSGDWRRAYADYLVQYTKFYAQEGIRITDLGFTNEPNWTTSYASMRFTPEQAVEFAKVVGPGAQDAGLGLACCDVVGWDGQKTYTGAIEADATARGLVDLHTGHSYGSHPDSPLPTSKPTWMSEWSPSGTSWNENWDDGSGYDGFTVANAIHTALTQGNVTGYVYWFGASTNHTRGFIQLDGDSYHVSKRLWAMANYSRFIRPGAIRIGASTSDGNVRLSAFRRSDGSVVVVALNTAYSGRQMTFSLPNTGIDTGTATPYLTNGANSTAAGSAIPVSSGAFTGTVPARSLVSYVVRGSGNTVTRYEAEDPPATCDGTIDSNWSGYSGSGFCNGYRAVGAGAQFTVDAGASGTATVAVRFANGSASGRPADVIVNGATARSVSFEPTGAWNSWASKTVTVPVDAGSNTIRFHPTGSAGNPNIDYIDVDGPAGSLPSSFQWHSSDPLIGPKSDATHNIRAVKDPSVVYHNGRYHVFATTTNDNGRYSMVYLNFTDWSQAGAATHYYLDETAIGSGYKAAPQVFYFAPERRWYLVFQTGSNAAYSTTTDISNPWSWSEPRHFYANGMPQIIRDNIGNGYWVDFWVICDSAKCYLFSSDVNGHLYRSETTVADFPNGFGNTVIAMQDADRYPLWEASNVYRVAGTGSYLLLVEAIGSGGRRYFRSWTAPAITGPWSALADTETNPFAHRNNVTFDGTPWTQDISHGEMIRSGVDQRLIINPCHLRYVYQGVDPDASDPYSYLPWRLGLLTQTNSTC